MENRGLSHLRIAEKLCLTPDRVSELSRLFDQPAEVQQMIDDRMITFSTLPIISRMSTDNDKVQAATMAATGKLSADQLRGRTQHFPQTTPSRKPQARSAGYSVERLNMFLIDSQSALRNFQVPSELTDRSIETVICNIGALISRLQEIRDALNQRRSS